jgi:hypothetical protein
MNTLHTPLHTAAYLTTTHYYILLHTTAYPCTHLRNDCGTDEVYELCAFDTIRTQQHALPNAMPTTSTAITAAVTMHMEQDMVVLCTFNLCVCVCVFVFVCLNRHIVSYVIRRCV